MNMFLSDNRYQRGKQMTTDTKQSNPIRQAAELVTVLEIDNYVQSGCKKYKGQAQLKRIEDYLWLEAIKAESR
jgi:hypothetical protein